MPQDCLCAGGTDSTRGGGASGPRDPCADETDAIRHSQCMGRTGAREQRMRRMARILYGAAG